MKRVSITGLIVLAALAWVAARPAMQRMAATGDDYRAIAPALETAAERGAAAFAFGDWGALSTDTLRTSASPWKLALAALVLQQAGGDAEAAAAVDIATLYRRWGFVTPETLANWPESLPEPRITAPLGQTVGLATRVFPPIAATIGNIGCAACHAGPVYDATGTPDLAQVWLGTPNTSINLEAWTRDLFTALRDHSGDADLLMETVLALFPETGLRERLTLRYVLLPEVREVIAARDAAYGRLLPFRGSLAGATNGLDSLRNRLGLIPEGEVLSESSFNSIPDLGARLYRTRLLNSGSYALPGRAAGAAITPRDITPAHRAGLAGIVAYFTVPAMGVTAEVARAHVSTAEDVAAWMAVYRPQPFPGEIDTSLAARGQDIYARACAACHGSYDDSLTAPALLSFPNWEGSVGTDRARLDLLTPDVAEAVNSSAFGDLIDARVTGAYSAPPLAGLWSSAPYFHNGSVPTVRQVLVPADRSQRFRVGGHRLDLDALGIDLAPPPDWQPWSEPAEIDTSAFGLGNEGHEAEVEGLTTAEIDALLEYLKLL